MPVFLVFGFENKFRKVSLCVLARIPHFGVKGLETHTLCNVFFWGGDSVLSAYARVFGLF